MNKKALLGSVFAIGVLTGVLLSAVFNMTHAGSHHPSETSSGSSSLHVRDEAEAIKMLQAATDFLVSKFQGGTPTSDQPLQGKSEAERADPAKLEKAGPFRRLQHQ